jgi:hypothetical protein
MTYLHCHDELRQAFRESCDISAHILPNDSHEERGQIGCLFCLTIVSRDDHVLNFSATMALIIVAGMAFCPTVAVEPYVHSLGRKDET